MIHAYPAPLAVSRSAGGACELPKRMGQIISNAALYGQQHNLTRQSIDECYAFLVCLLEGHGRLNLSVSEGVIVVDGGPVDSKNPFVNTLATKLTALEITGFSLLKGMSKEEFEKLIGIVVPPPKGTARGRTFATAVSEEHLEHVETERVRYERVTEREIVVDRNAVGANGEAGREGGDEPQKDVSARPAQAVEQIMAFLKGDVTTQDAELRKAMHETSSDAEHLASLIMEASVLRQEAGAVDAGESLADIVLGCLRRTYEGLRRDPHARTRKGGKHLKKTMLLLEKSVLEKLRALAGGPDPARDAAISRCVADLLAAGDVDAAVAEYSSKRRGLEKAEREILGCLKRADRGGVDDPEVEERMVAAGLSRGDWRRLVVRSGGVGGPGRAGAPAGLAALAVLLAELDHIMSAPGAAADEVHRAAARVGQEVERTVWRAEQKIEAWADRVEEERRRSPRPQEAGKPRRRASEVLAEIVQEFCQPLSVVSCTVDMLLVGRAGTISKQQKELLDVAAQCGERLQELMSKLVSVVGVPDGLKPDKQLIESAASRPRAA